MELHHVVGGIRAVQRVEVNLPDRAPVGPHDRLQILGQADLRQPFKYPLPIPIVLRVVIEDQHHAREAEEGGRS